MDMRPVPGTQKRRFPRYPADLPIQVTAVRGNRRETAAGRMLDVSEGGLSFVGGRYLPPDTVVFVEFLECRLSGRVRHCRLREYASRVEFVTGVEIEQVINGVNWWKDLRRSAG